MALARNGDEAGALDALDSAESRTHSTKATRLLGFASGAVALELERRLTFTEAMVAWMLAERCARDGDAPILEWIAHDRMYAAHEVATSARRQSR
jgi:hypothetical protein